MGYYTDYSLNFCEINIGKDSVVTTSNNIQPIVEQGVLEEIKRMDIFDEVYDNSIWVNAKWYEWEEDMRLLSSKFPEVLFELSGQGESPEDMWVAYFHNGRMQYCPAKITYDDFDVSKLTEWEEGKRTTQYSS